MTSFLLLLIGPFLAPPDLLQVTGAPAMEARSPGHIVLADTLAGDTYGDPGVRSLLARARQARSRELEGIESYEARVWERIRAGLTGRSFRRERDLFLEERTASVRWEDDGTRYIRWEGARRASPVAGVRSDEDASMAEELAQTLSSVSGGSSPIFHQPGDDRILFGSEEWALHPLADTAHTQYRYRGGDTLRITLPPEGRTVTLVEIRVEPRRADPRLVVGSLWIAEASGELVRAAYRPARPLYLATDFDDEGRGGEPPGLFRALQLEIRQVTVDYSLQEMQWWLPYRFSLSLELRAGGFIQMPATVEWRMDGYRVNEAPTPELVSDEVPEGWTLNDRLVAGRGPDAEEGDSVRIVTRVPPAGLLHASPLLTPLDGSVPGLGPPPGFSDAELDAFRRELDDILPRTDTFRPRVSWGLGDGLLRYNRVEGLSPGVAGELPLFPGWSARVEARLGTADPVPLGELRVRRGDRDRHLQLSLYHRLDHGSDWDDPLNLPSSVSSLVTGGDHGEYHRAHGLDARFMHMTRWGQADVGLFLERHRAVDRNTDFHLFGLFNEDTLRLNRSALEGTWLGAEGGLRGHRGSDPGGLRVFGDVRGEVAVGEGGGYQRVRLSGGGARSLGPMELGMEVGAGSGWGDLPPQRSFLLGGPSTLRGYRSGALPGESFWFGRLEAARGLPSARLSLFNDWGWAGSRTDFGSGRPQRAVGAGISILDGLWRMDLARRLGEDSGWRLHVYFDGIL
jgi:hypothetical protein